MAFTVVYCTSPSSTSVVGQGVGICISLRTWAFGKLFIPKIGNARASHLDKQQVGGSRLFYF